MKKEKILLIGDSWFAGCWGEDSKIVHPGVTGFLRKHNYIVKNIAVGGFDNMNIATSVRELAEKTDISEYHILSTFTDPMRIHDVLSDDGNSILGNIVYEVNNNERTVFRKI